MNICIVVDEIGDSICEELSITCDKSGFIYGYNALRDMLITKYDNI